MQMDLYCPFCSHKLNKYNLSSLYKGRKLHCSHCQNDIVIGDHGFTSIQREFDKFSRELKRIFR